MVEIILLSHVGLWSAQFAANERFVENEIALVVVCVRVNSFDNFFEIGTVLKILPKCFLGYRKLLVTIVHTDSYVINVDNFKNLNDHLKNGCVLVQGYGITAEHYEAFPFSQGKFKTTRTIANYSKLQLLIQITILDSIKQKWINHKGVQKLEEVLNLKETCGYITFINTGVPDLGCENYDPEVHLVKPVKRNSGAKERRRSSQTQQNIVQSPSMDYIVCIEEYSHHSGYELISNKTNLLDILNTEATTIEQKSSRIGLTNGWIGDYKLCQKIAEFIVKNAR